MKTLAQVKHHQQQQKLQMTGWACNELHYNCYAEEDGQVIASE